MDARGARWKRHLTRRERLPQFFRVERFHVCFSDFFLVRKDFLSLKNKARVASHTFFFFGVALADAQQSCILHLNFHRCTIREA